MSQQDFPIKSYDGVAGRDPAPDAASREALNGNILLIWISAFTVIAIIGAVIQLAFFYGADGTLLPISGLVKTTGIGPETVQTGWLRFMSVLSPFATLMNEVSFIHTKIAAAAFVALLGFRLENAVEIPGDYRNRTIHVRELGQR